MAKALLGHLGGPDPLVAAELTALRRRITALEDEVDFCLDWIDDLYEIAPMLRVRRNYPRRGTQDSITRAMRTEFSNQPYVGIELALNRAWASRPLKIRDEAIDGLSDSLLEIFRVPSVEAA